MMASITRRMERVDERSPSGLGLGDWVDAYINIHLKEVRQDLRPKCTRSLNPGGEAGAMSNQSKQRPPNRKGLKKVRFDLDLDVWAEDFINSHLKVVREDLNDAKSERNLTFWVDAYINDHMKRMLGDLKSHRSTDEKEPSEIPTLLANSEDVGDRMEKGLGFDLPMFVDDYIDNHIKTVLHDIKDKEEGLKRTHSGEPDDDLITRLVDDMIKQAVSELKSEQELDCKQENIVTRFVDDVLARSVAVVLMEEDSFIDGLVQSAISEVRKDVGHDAGNSCQLELHKKKGLDTFVNEFVSGLLQKVVKDENARITEKQNQAMQRQRAEMARKAYSETGYCYKYIENRLITIFGSKVDTYAVHCVTDTMPLTESWTKQFRAVYRTLQRMEDGELEFPVKAPPKIPLEERQPVPPKLVETPKSDAQNDVKVKPVAGREEGGDSMSQIENKQETPLTKKKSFSHRFLSGIRNSLSRLRFSGNGKRRSKVATL